MFWISRRLALMPTSFMALSVASLFLRLSTIYSQEDQLVSQAEALQTRLRIFFAIIFRVKARNNSYLHALVRFSTRIRKVPLNHTRGDKLQSYASFNQTFNLYN